MEFANEFEIAQKVIKEAGKLALSYFEKGVARSFKEDYSVLTEADEAVEKYIKSKLSRQFPEYGFIGEESVAEEKNIAWIVDPIDGTVAFARHILEFGIALALKKGNQLIFCIQSLPITGNLITAYTGHGAHDNGKQLKVSTVSDPKKALFSLGAENFWVENYQPYSLQILTKNYKKRFRSGPSSVVESYYLASGKVDALIKLNQALWDAGPASLLMKEAGAIVTDEFGRPLNLQLSAGTKYNYVATNKFLAKNAKDVLYKKL